LLIKTRLVLHIFKLIFIIILVFLNIYSHIYIVFLNTEQFVGQELVSSGKLKSMHLLPKTYPDCPHGYVFSEAPFGEISEQRLIFLPVYYAYKTGLSGQHI